MSRTRSCLRGRPRTWLRRFRCPSEGRSCTHHPFETVATDGGTFPGTLDSRFSTTWQPCCGAARAGTGTPPILFAVALHKASFPQHDPYERVYEEFFARCNGLIGRLASNGDMHRCVAIADKSRLESRLQDLMSAWRTRGASTGAAIRPMRGYAEVPLFVDSHASRCVQLADFVAYSVYRAYAAGDDRLLDRLIGGFHAEDGVIHGLVHLVSRYRECLCAACKSRQ
ncbi:MAG: hypothetical protein C0506_00025 [Anaerolinea sp.]|nr:hypothetical protein [Anaerolinea sp.]